MCLSFLVLWPITRRPTVTYVSSLWILNKQHLKIHPQRSKLNSNIQLVRRRTGCRGYQAHLSFLFWLNCLQVKRSCFAAMVCMWWQSLQTRLPPSIRIPRADGPVKSLHCNLKESVSRLRSLVRPHLTDMAVTTSWPGPCNRGWYWFTAKIHNFQPPVANSKTFSSSSWKWSSGFLLPA